MWPLLSEVQPSGKGMVLKAKVLVLGGLGHAIDASASHFFNDKMKIVDLTSCYKSYSCCKDQKDACKGNV